MTGYTFGKINLPGPAGTYVFISVAGVDAAGLAVGNYGDSNDDFHGFTANSGTPVVFDPPDSSNTNVGGVTSVGEIFGNDTNFQNQEVGFVYNNGTFTVIDAPLAQATTVFGVTNGQVFGGYVDVFGGSHGFIDNNGVYTQVDAPGATSTTIMGVTPSGELAGTFIDSSDRVHGFIDNNGTFATIDAPGSSGTFVVGISANGVVAGTYDDNANNQYGFTDTNGLISTISITGAIGTAVTGINSSGEVVGYYIDAADNVHGFVDNGGVITTVDLPGATQTDIQGINDAGDIYGYYNDSTGQQHGFVGTATTATTTNPTVSNTSGTQETLTAPQANTIIEGSGYDILNLSQNPIATASSAYTMTTNGNGTWNLATSGSTDLVSGIMQVEFSNTTMTVEAHSSLNEYIALLYQGALGRTPDADLAGWEQIAAALPPSDFQSLGVYALSNVSGGYSGSLSIAAGFTNSTEFINKYGSLTNAQFVTDLYSNILDRAPDTAGFNGWMSMLTAGDSREYVLVGFADSAEAISNATQGFTGQSGAHAAGLFLT